MCGLYGAFGKGINPSIIRALAILNETRGHEATGFFNSKGLAIKTNDKSTTVLRQANFTSFIEQSCKNCWGICGHTRASTRGNNTAANAHPFRYGKEGEDVVGSHNGSLDAPHKYSVDTEYAIDLLSQAPPGDYKGALSNVAGWYVLTWRDARDRAIYLLNWKGSLAFCGFENCIYYSSSEEHLKTAIGNVNTKVTKSGDVWRYDGHKFTHLPKFTGKERWENQNSNFQQRNRSYGFQNHHNYKKPEWPGATADNPHGMTGEIQKWDDGFWWACLHRTNAKGETEWIKLGNQACWNRSYPGIRLAEPKYPGLHFLLSEAQVEEMQKANAEKAKKGTLIIQDNKTPPLLARVVENAIEDVAKNVSQEHAEEEAEALVKLCEEINEFKQRYGTDFELNRTFGPNMAMEAELEAFQEDCIKSLKDRGWSTEAAVKFVRDKGLFQLGAGVS